MGQYSMNAYDADIYLRQFKGLISNGNDPDGNLEYAVEAKNVDTTDGFLQPAADPEIVYAKDHASYKKTPDELFLNDFDNPYWTSQTYNGRDGKYWREVTPPTSPPTYVELTDEEKEEAREKFLQYFTGDTKAITDEGYKSKFRLVARTRINTIPYEATIHRGDKPINVWLYVFACGNGFFVMTVPDTMPGEDPPVSDLVHIHPVDITIKVGSDGTIYRNYYESWDVDNPPAYQDLTWSAVVFQSNETLTSPGPTPSGDDYYGFADNAIYLSNKEKGLYCIQAYLHISLDVLTPSFELCIQGCKIDTPINFDKIESFGERLWGCRSEKDTESLYYSAPYNPFDWQQNADQPADGAGQILEPNWDGDYFTGLRTYGNSLIAFKTHRAWKVNGVDIATMVVTEQYGFGTEFVETVISSGERLYMATRNGLAVYDGSTIRPLMLDNLRNLWSRIRQSAMDKMRAFLYENRKYCLAVPVDSDENNTLIVYDTLDGTVFYYENMNFISFMQPILAQEPIVLWRDTARTNLKQFDFNAWEKNLSGSRATRWMTPWIELGRKDIQKGGHDFYFTPEVKGENAVTFTISFQTEKKTKTKQYTVQPMTAEQLAAGKQGKTKRLHFGGTGRRFRIIIETPSGVDAGKAYKWRLYGGIHLITEIDKD